MQSQSSDGAWRSRSTFVFVFTAAAVGLANLWRFAYLLGEHGGAFFLLAYLLALFTVAVPVLIAEVVLGSQARTAPTRAWRLAAQRSLLGRGWGAWAVLACVAGMLLLAYGTVVAGWSLAYAWDLGTGTFASVSAREAAAFLDTLLASTGRMLFWQTLFLGAVVAISAAGVRWGIGACAWLLIPLLATLFWLLIDFSLRHGDVAAAQAFLFSAQRLDFDAEALFLALSQALFTLGIGLAIGTTYGSYAPDRLPLGRSVLAVAILDSAMALAAGVVIFPLILGSNLAPDLGPGLLFVGVPYAFGNLPQGELYGCLFFLLVALASLGTAVALLEPSVSALLLASRRPRWQVASALGLLAWVLALAVALSLAPASPLAGLLPWLDRLVARWLLPAGALAVAVFVGWLVDPALLRRELYRESSGFFNSWLHLLRFVAPVSLVVVWFWLAVAGP